MLLRVSVSITHRTMLMHMIVAERLKAQGRQEMAMLEKQEEFEDKDGNVYVEHFI